MHGYRSQFYQDKQNINLPVFFLTETFVYKKFICQGVKDKIQCYGGRKIEITDAYYGRTEFFKCGVGLTRSCKAKGSQEKVINVGVFCPDQIRIKNR